LPLGQGEYVMAREDWQADLQKDSESTTSMNSFYIHAKDEGITDNKNHETISFGIDDGTWKEEEGQTTVRMEGRDLCWELFQWRLCRGLYGVAYREGMRPLL